MVQQGMSAVKIKEKYQNPKGMVAHYPVPVQNMRESFVISI